MVASIPLRRQSTTRGRSEGGRHMQPEPGLHMIPHFGQAVSMSNHNY